MELDGTGVATVTTRAGQPHIAVGGAGGTGVATVITRAGEGRRPVGGFRLRVAAGRPIYVVDEPAGC